MSKKAVTIQRVSTKMQELEGFSLENQKDSTMSYCQKRGLEIINNFEIVESSTRGERKQFMEAINFIKKQKFCVALVSITTDRIFRNFKNYTMIDELRQQGKLELHLIRDSLIIDKDSKCNDLTRLGINIVMAQSYALSVRDNVTENMECQADKGYCMSKAPLGYNNIRMPDGRANVIIDEEKAPLVKKLFEHYETGLYSISEITQKCREWGFMNRSNTALINTSAVYRILNCKFYHGISVFRNKERPHIYERLITEKTFENCQKILKGKGKAEARQFKYGSRPFVFRGLIQCSCGCTITSYIKKEKYTYLRCSHYKGNCDTKPLNEDIALAQVKTTLKNLHLDEEIMHYIRADMEKIIDKQNEFQRQQLAKARRKYDECDKGLKNIRLDYAKQKISAEEYNDISAVLKEEQYKLNDEINSLTQADEHFSIALGTVLSLGSNAYDIFSSSQVETKRAILNIVLANFKLDGQKFSYDLRKPFDWVQSLNKKTPSKKEGVAIGDPNGIRTRVAALRGPRPRPLDDGTVKTKNVIGYI